MEKCGLRRNGPGLGWSVGGRCLDEYGIFRKRGLARASEEEKGSGGRRGEVPPASAVLGCLLKKELWMSQ